MISQSVILEEIDNGCYGCYAKGTDENKIKNNEGVKNLLMNEIKTLEDLGSYINEYEVDKAFLDKMKYIKEHKNETDNLIYTGGLDFFRQLKQTLNENLQGGLYLDTGMFNAERDKFMEQYEVPKAPDIEIPEAVLKNLDADDVYILYVTEDDGYLFFGKDDLVRSIDNTGKEIARSNDYLWYTDLKEHKTKFYVYKYNIFLYVE